MRWKVGDGVGQRVKGPGFIIRELGFVIIGLWILLDQAFKKWVGL